MSIDAMSSTCSTYIHKALHVAPHLTPESSVPVTLSDFLARAPFPGSYRGRPPRLVNTRGGVFTNFRPFRLTTWISPKSKDSQDFSPFSPRSKGSGGEKEGEVSDPPFFVPRTSRKARPCNTPCNTSVNCGGVAHFPVTTPLIPAGRRESDTRSVQDRIHALPERQPGPPPPSGG